MKQMMNPGLAAYSQILPATKLKSFREQLSKSRQISIVTHYDADGDAIGSSLAVLHYLQQKGNFPVQVFTPNDYPGFLYWLPGHEKVVVFEHFQKEAEHFIHDSDMIIYLDFNTLSRLKKMQHLFRHHSAFKMLIDHHPVPNIPSNLVFSDIQPSSTSEIIFYLILAMGDTALINTQIADCLFTGIMTDTGCFSFNSSRPETWQAVAELLKQSIDKDSIFSLIYENYSDERMRLMGYCLNEKMKILPELHTAYISLTKDELARYRFKPGDSEGFVNLPFSIQGIKLTALFIERDDHIKISLRSKGNIAINHVAQEYFSGGGHRNAAGGESKLTLEETIEKFISLLPNYEKELR